MSLKANKLYEGWENDWRATKLYKCVCKLHGVRLEENETYLFRIHADGGLITFDEDEVDLSGMSCPKGTEDEPCDDNWAAEEITDYDAYMYTEGEYLA